LKGEDTSDWLVVLPQSSHYMLAFDNSRVVAGATGETDSGFDYRQTVGGVHEVICEALQIAPGLSQGTLKEVRICLRPMGEDSLPLLGKLDEVGQVTVATGLGPSDLTMGPYVGYLAACLETGEETGMDLSAYHPLREAAVNCDGHAGGEIPYTVRFPFLKMLYLRQIQIEEEGLHHAQKNCFRRPRAVGYRKNHRAGGLRQDRR